MKKLILMMIFCSVAVTAKADQNIALDPVNAADVDRCVSLPQNLKPLYLTDVTHGGEDESVGVIKKGDFAEKIFVANDLRRVFKDSLRNTLQRCGYTLTSDPKALHVSLFIKDFFTKSANKGLVGQDEANLMMTLKLEIPGQLQKYQIDFGVEKSAKAPPFMKAKRFSKILNATLIDVMNQVATSDTLAKTVSAASKTVAPAVIDPNTTYFQNGD